MNCMAFEPIVNISRFAAQQRLNIPTVLCSHCATALYRFGRLCCRETQPHRLGAIPPGSSTAQCPSRGADAVSENPAWVLSQP